MAAVNLKAGRDHLLYLQLQCGDWADWGTDTAWQHTQEEEENITFLQFL